MNTVSIYFFRLSDMAPGVLNDCCIVVPSEGETFSLESLSRATRDFLCPMVVPSQTAREMKLLHSPRYSPWLVRSDECPASVCLQMLEFLAAHLPVGEPAST